MDSSTGVQRILAFNAGREPERLALKYQRMLADPFAFTRGSNHLFQARLQPVLAADRLLAAAPLAWVCGDLHLENFGSYKGDDRQVYIDINDFDDAALAPVTVDLVRLLASLWVSAATLSVNRAQASAWCEDLIEAYAHRLSTGKPQGVDKDTAEGALKKLLKSAEDRRRVDLLERRTTRHQGVRVLRCDGTHALAATPSQRQTAVDLIGAFAQHDPNPAFFDVLDVARRIAGTGSLGLVRDVVLVLGKGAPDGHYLLDLKVAQPSCLDALVTTVQPTWASPAHRIVALQFRLQAVSVAFLHALNDHDGPSYVLRGLQPSEDRVTLADVVGASLKGGDNASVRTFVRCLGQITASAHLRGTARQRASGLASLTAFGGQSSVWRAALLDVAAHSADLVHQDWAAFVEARSTGAHPATVRPPPAAAA